MITLSQLLAPFSRSLETLNHANSIALELLKLCTFLHPRATPEEIFTEGASELGPALQPIAADPFALNIAINELRKFSLIRRDLDAKTLTIHPLVQSVLKDNMNEDTRFQWAERTVRVVSCAFPNVEFATWQRCQRFLPHAQVCAKLIDQWQMKFPEATKLLSQAGYYLCVRAQFTEAEPLLKRALEIGRTKIRYP